MKKDPRIVLLGGGTGSFALIQGLKSLTSNLTAIVSMSDDGGSTGVLRDELGVLPPGDVRKCLVALSDLSEVRDLFDYRFSEGRLSGQSLGNLILSGLELRYGSFEDAIRVAGELLHVHGAVVPVTLRKHMLIAEDEGHTYQGEHLIDDGNLHLTQGVNLHLEPSSRLNPVARATILAADLIVIAPGSLYTSLIPLLLVSGMPQALAEAQASVISVANLINKPRQTDNWHVVDYVKQLERYMGEGAIDMVLYNDQPIASTLLTKYAADNELPVDIDSSRFGEVHAKAIPAHLVSADMSTRDPADMIINRTLIRHDGLAVARELRKLLV